MADGFLTSLEPGSACSVLALVFLIVEAGAAGGLGRECTPGGGGAFVGVRRLVSPTVFLR